MNEKETKDMELSKLPFLANSGSSKQTPNQKSNSALKEQAQRETSDPDSISTGLKGSGSYKHDQSFDWNVLSQLSHRQNEALRESIGPLSEEQYQNRSIRQVCAWNAVLKDLQSVLVQTRSVSAVRSTKQSNFTYFAAFATHLKLQSVGKFDWAEKEVDFKGCYENIMRPFCLLSSDLDTMLLEHTPILELFPTELIHFYLERSYNRVGYWLHTELLRFKAGLLHLYTKFHLLPNYGFNLKLSVSTLESCPPLMRMCIRQFNRTHTIPTVTMAQIHSLLSVYFPSVTHFYLSSNTTVQLEVLRLIETQLSLGNMSTIHVRDLLPNLLNRLKNLLKQEELFLGRVETAKQEERLDPFVILSISRMFVHCRIEVAKILIHMCVLLVDEELLKVFFPSTENKEHGHAFDEGSFVSTLKKNLKILAQEATLLDDGTASWTKTTNTRTAFQKVLSENQFNDLTHNYHLNSILFGFVMTDDPFHSLMLSTVQMYLEKEDKTKVVEQFVASRDLLKYQEIPQLSKNVNELLQLLVNPKSDTIMKANEVNLGNETHELFLFIANTDSSNKHSSVQTNYHKVHELFQKLKADCTEKELSEICTDFISTVKQTVEDVVQTGNQNVIQLFMLGLPTCIIASLLLIVQRHKTDPAGLPKISSTPQLLTPSSKPALRAGIDAIIKLFEKMPVFSAVWGTVNHEFLHLLNLMLDEDICAGLQIITSIAQMAPEILITQKKINSKVMVIFQRNLSKYSVLIRETLQYLNKSLDEQISQPSFSVPEIVDHLETLRLLCAYFRLVTGKAVLSKAQLAVSSGSRSRLQPDLSLELQLQTSLSATLLPGLGSSLKSILSFFNRLPPNDQTLKVIVEQLDPNHFTTTELTSEKRLAISAYRTKQEMLSLFSSTVSNLQLPHLSNLCQVHDICAALTFDNIPTQYTLSLQIPLFDVCADVRVFPQNLRFFLEMKPLDNQEEYSNSSLICSAPSISKSLSEGWALLQIVTREILPKWQKQTGNSFGDDSALKQKLQNYLVHRVFPLMYKICKGLESVVTVTQNEKLKHSGQVKSYLAHVEQLYEWCNQTLLPLMQEHTLMQLGPLTAAKTEQDASAHKDWSPDELGCPELQSLRQKCRAMCIYIEDLLCSTPSGFRYIESFDRLNALKRKKSKLDEHLQQTQLWSAVTRQEQISRYDRIQSLHADLLCLTKVEQPKMGGPYISLQQFKAVCEVYELKKLEWSSQENNSFIRFLEEHPEQSKILLSFVRHRIEEVFGDHYFVSQLPVVYESVEEGSTKAGYFCHFMTRLIGNERVYLDQLELLEVALRHSQSLRRAMIPPTGINDVWKIRIHQIFLVLTQLVKYLSIKTFHDATHARLQYLFEVSVDFLINVFEQNSNIAKLFSTDKLTKVRWTNDKSFASMLDTILQYIRMFLDQSDLAQRKYGGWISPSDKPENFKLLNGMLKLLLELSSGPSLIVQEAIPQEYLEFFITMMNRVVLDVSSPYYELIALPSAAFLETFTEDVHRVISTEASNDLENARADKRISLLGALLKSKELETTIVKLIKKLVVYSKLKSNPAIKKEINEKLKQDLQKKIDLYKAGKYAPAQGDQRRARGPATQKERKSVFPAQQQQQQVVDERHFKQEDEDEMGDQFLFDALEPDFQQENAHFQEQQMMEAPFYEQMLVEEESEHAQMIQQNQIQKPQLNIEEANQDVDENMMEPLQIHQKDLQPLTKLEYYPQVDLYGLKSLNVKKQDIFLDQTTQKLIWLESLHQDNFRFSFRDQDAVILDDLHNIQNLSWKPQELIDLYTIDAEFGNHYILKTCIQMHTMLVNLCNKNEVYYNEALNRAKLMFAYFGELVPRDVLIDLELESQDIVKFNSDDASDEIKVFLFLSQVTQKIEIAISQNSQGHSIRQVHFQLHPLCMMLTHETRVDFLESRDPENSLEEVVENQRVFEIEMEHNLENIRRGKLFYNLALHDNITFHKYIVWTLTLVLNWLLMFAARTDSNGSQEYFIFPTVFFDIYAWFIFGYSVAILFFWLSSRYRQNVDIARQKLKILYKSKRLNIRDLIDIYVVRSMLVKSTPQQLFSHILFALLSVFVHPFFHTLHLLLLVLISKTAYQIVRSITTYPKQLLVTLELAIIVIYIFAYLVFEFYNKDWDGLVDNNGRIQMCQDMWECIFYSVNLGFRSGLGSAFGTPEAHTSAWVFLGKFGFNLSFNILINTVILNIVFGIIIDTFANIRDKAQSRKDFLYNYCVVCRKSRDTIELEGGEFDSHIYSRHYLWKYVNYRVYLSNKNRYDLSTSENMIWRIINEGSTDWIPTEKVLSSIPDMKAQLLTNIESSFKKAFKVGKDSVEKTLEQFSDLKDKAIKSVEEVTEGYGKPTKLRYLLG